MMAKKRNTGTTGKSTKNEPEVSASVPPICMREDEQLMTTRELMDFLNLSRTKLWELVNKEGLPAFKIGGDYRYKRSEVLVWLEKYRVKSQVKHSD